jgi:hypothetical protein
MTSTPCDTPGGEATPLLDLEKCVPEEQDAPPPADDQRAAKMCGQWFLRPGTYLRRSLHRLLSFDRLIDLSPKKQKTLTRSVMLTGTLPV